MKSILKKIFGGLRITWPKLICFAAIMGIYTALMAMYVPDGNSFRDIAVLPEWWVLPAMLIILNSKKPLEAALKTFIFFLISQPLVYLIQVPFNQMGWSLFGYYPYWFKITLLTFPAAFVCWFIKKNKWYSGVILSFVTAFLAFMGISYIHSLIETPPNHLITIIYCFAMIPVLIIATLKDKLVRLIPAVAAVLVIIACVILGHTEPFETYNNQFLSENNITFVGEPYISQWSGEGQGNVEIIRYEGGYNFKLSGLKGKRYSFVISDDENEYHFEYYFDKDQETVLVKRVK